MSNLDVALRLKLVNGLKAGAGEAKRDLDGIGKAARGLGKSRGVDQLGRDIEQASARAKRLERQLAGLKRARGLTGMSGDFDAAAGSAKRLEATTRRLAANLGTATQNAASLRRELAGVASAAQRADRVGAGLRRIGARGGRGGSFGPGRDGGRAGMDGTAPIGALAGRLGAGALGIGGGAYAAGAAARKSVKTFADLETSAKDLGITADQTDETVSKSVENFRAQAAKYGSTAKEMLDTAKTFVAAGLDYNTAVEAVVPTVKTAKASFGDLQETAKAGVAAINNLEIKVKDLPEAFDRMAKAGKEGNVELKNLARVLPSVAASGSKLGLKGLSGLTDITAALEILGKVTATPDEAANRLENLFEKITADETVKNFKKVGEAMGKTIDLEKEIEKGAKNGESALAVTLRLTRELTKGNPFRINELFGDMQARAAIEGLLKFESEYNGIRDRITKSSKGMIDQDFARATGRLAADFEKLGAAWDRLAGRIGEGLAPSVSAVTKEATAFLERLDKGETILQRMATRYGLGGDEAGKKDIEGKLNGEGAAEKWAEENLPFLSGKKWNDWIDERIGKTRADADGMRDKDAYADRAAERAKVLAKPDEIGEQIKRRRELLDRSRERANGAPGIQRDVAAAQVGKSEAEIARLEGELAKATAAVEALNEARTREIAAIEALASQVQSLERTAGFGVDGVKGKDGEGIGRNGLGFGPNGVKGPPLPPRRPDDLKAEVKAEPQDLSGVGKQTMDTYGNAVKAGLAKVEAEVTAAAGRMKTALSFTATPTITPRVSAPAGGGSASAAPASTGGGSGGGAGTRSAGLRRGSGGNTFSGPIHVHGVRDVASLQRGIQREADRKARDARNDALHDTGTDFA